MKAIRGRFNNVVSCLAGMCDLSPHAVRVVICRFNIFVRMS